MDTETTSPSTRRAAIVHWLMEYSIPLIAGVIAALWMANYAPHFYHSLVDTPISAWWQDHSTAGHHAAHGHGWEHYLTLHFLINDIFMVFFFGIAAKEITEACLPQGALNPISKAVNPLCATVGGIIGPVAVFLMFNSIWGSPDWTAGWGITTATDIALAWLVARVIFGPRHPAISFLLLLAVADDAIGLGIIAIAYPDPSHPTQWLNTMWIVPGMIVAFGLRRLRIKSWLPYVLIGGSFSWWGLYSAHLHPALALVFIVPWMPGPNVDLGLYAERKSRRNGFFARIFQWTNRHRAHSPLENFEHDLRTFVDFGLFFFALANAGASCSHMSALTWIVVGALFVGKTVGVTLCSIAAEKAGFSLPDGMDRRHLFVTGMIAGLGLTVALFVSGLAFTDTGTQAAAKMGAVLSAGVAVLAYVAATVLGVSKVQPGGLARLWRAAASAGWWSTKQSARG